jgi:hypothetical protein
VSQIRIMPGRAVAMLLLALGCGGGEEVDPIADACQKQCAAITKPTCPGVSIGWSQCLMICESSLKKPRQYCPNEVDTFVACERGAKTWSCKDGTEEAEGCPFKPVACCVNAKLGNNELLCAM